MSQKDFKALAEQATLMDDTSEPKSQNNTAALEVSDQALPAVTRPAKELPPEEAKLRWLRMQYKARYGFKPVGKTIQDLELAIQTFDRSVS
jgi:hypothetical protein